MSSVKGFKEFEKKLEKLSVEAKETVIKNTLNKTANYGLAVAKKNTPVGVYSNQVSFTTKDGKQVSFKVTPKQGGTLRRGWKTSAIKKTSNNTYQKELFNNVEYALYVDQGHRIVETIDGKQVTKGWVNGRFMLDKAENAMLSQATNILSSELNKIL